jgi:hypothetical protein
VTWDDRKDTNGKVLFSGGVNEDFPGYPFPNFVCYNLYYEIRYNYNKTSLTLERKY